MQQSSFAAWFRGNNGKYAGMCLVCKTANQIKKHPNHIGHALPLMQQHSSLTACNTLTAHYRLAYTHEGTGAGTLYHGLGSGGEVRLTSQNGEVALKVGSIEVSAWLERKSLLNFSIPNTGKHTTHQPPPHMHFIIITIIIMP